MDNRIFLFFFISIGLIHSQPEPTTNYANMKTLAENNTYILYWNYNATDITFEVHIKSSGWGGFGKFEYFSKNTLLV